MGLWQDFLTNDQRVIHKWEHYFPIYERHFSRYVNRTPLVFEIGVFKGGSLQMWKRYLGPNARIVGIDIDPACKRVEESQISVRIGDQADSAFLHKVLHEFGEPDIVIDDGSHKQDHVHASFRTLYPYMRSDGVYLIEDLHVAYRAGMPLSGSFVETAKSLVDEMNTLKTVRPSGLSEFGPATMSMHFYPQIIVFEKGLHPLPHDLRTGSPTFGDS